MINASVQTNTVTRNTTYLTAAFVLQKLLSFVYFVFYANVIGAADTGKYIFAVSLVTIFGILIDLGFSPVIIREIARRRANAQTYLSTVIAVKLLFGLITGLLIVILVHYLGYPLITQQLIWLATIVMIAESFTLTLYGVWRGFQNLKYEAIGSILFQLVTFAVGFVGLRYFKTPLILGLAIIVGALANLAFAMFQVRRKLRLLLKPAWHDETLRFLARTAIPFFIAGVFTKIYAYLDIVMLSFLKGDQFVGWYSIAYKLTYSLQFLPIAFSNAIYPVFSQQFIDDRQSLGRSLENGLHYVIVISVPVSLGAALLAGEIVTTLWPTFTNAIPALRVGIVGLSFVFANFILASFLNACNRQKLNTINLGLTMVVNAVLNLVLIPRFGHVGAATAAVFSALFLFLLDLWWARRITTVRFGRLLAKAVATLTAAGAMGLVVQFLPFHLFIIIPLGAVVYVGAVFATRALTVSEFKSLWYSLTLRRRIQAAPTTPNTF